MYRINDMKHSINWDLSQKIFPFLSICHLFLLKLAFIVLIACFRMLEHKLYHLLLFLTIEAHQKPIFNLFGQGNMDQFVENMINHRRWISTSKHVFLISSFAHSVQLFLTLRTRCIFAIYGCAILSLKCIHEPTVKPLKTYCFSSVNISSQVMGNRNIRTDCISIFWERNQIYNANDFSDALKIEPSTLKNISSIGVIFSSEVLVIINVVEKGSKHEILIWLLI